MNHNEFVADLYNQLWKPLDSNVMLKFYNRNATWQMGQLHMQFEQMHHRLRIMKETCHHVDISIRKILHHKDNISVWYHQVHYDYNFKKVDQINTITTLKMDDDKIFHVNCIWDKSPEEIIQRFSMIEHKQRRLPKTEIGQSLTRREQQIFFYIIQGNTNRLIADKLSISQRTVESHVNSIKFKLGLDNSKQFIEFAITHGYLELSSIFTEIF